MSEILANFQFIRPMVLLAVIPVVIGYVLKLKYANKDNLWQHILPAHLYQNMIINKSVYQSNGFIHLAFTALVLSIFAIAGPSWEKLPQSVYQSQAGKVILIDMSMSMRATDIAPNRLTRAKFKALDLIDEVQEGETGVIAYAGDAFVISPLTDDITNLKTLIPSLSPEIMPEQGSYALFGLERAEELLVNAGYQTGQIYWITDGIKYEEVDDIRQFVQSTNFEISSLLVGTEAGAPISMLDGQLLKDRTGKIVIPSIDERYMNQALQGTGANYQLFTSDNSDIQAIKRKVQLEEQQRAQQVENTTSDVFKDMGPYLVLLLLPVAAYSFRKGILSLALVSLLSTYILASPTIVFAQAPVISSDIPVPESEFSESLLDKIFKNADQRGKQAYDSEYYNEAKSLFEDKAWQAASAYKSGDYEKAEMLYSELSGVENNYNLANAQAKQGKLEEALAGYEQVLNQQPEHANALQNKKLVEELLNQQQQSQDQDSENNNSEQKPNNDQSNDRSQENSEQQESEQQNDDAQQSDEQNSQEQQQSSEQSENEEQQNQQGDAEMQNQPEQLPGEEQPEQEQESLDTSESQTQDAQEQEATEQEQKAAISNAMDMQDLTPEEQEELQRMQMIMNKVPDDPAFLLKRKMLLEAQQRKRAPKPPTQENW